MRTMTESAKASAVSSRDEEQPWMHLVRRNLPLVKYVLGKINKNLPPCVDRDDLLAAGSLGLIETARRFNPGRKVPFHSYAIPRIWGSMLDELRKHDWLSTDMRDQVRKLEQGIATLRQNGSEQPTIDEIAAHMGCSTKRVAKLMAASDKGRHCTGADTVTHEDTHNGVYERLGTRPPRNPYEEAEFQDNAECLAAAIDKLPGREKQVVVLRYKKHLYLHEIGKVLQVSESRVCQIHTKALHHLHTALKRKGIGVA